MCANYDSPNRLSVIGLISTTSLPEHTRQWCIVPDVHFRNHPGLSRNDKLTCTSFVLWFDEETCVFQYHACT